MLEAAGAAHAVALGGLVRHPRAGGPLRRPRRKRPVESRGFRRALTGRAFCCFLLAEPFLGVAPKTRGRMRRGGSGHGQASGGRLRGQRLHHPLPRALLAGGARRRRARDLEPEPRPRRGGGGPGALAAGGRGQGLLVPRGDGEGARDRRDLDLRTEPRAHREHGGDRGRAGRGGRARGHRLREAAGPQRGRGAAHGRAGQEGGRPARLPRGPALLARPRARPRHRLGARGRALGPSLPGPGRRGAQRAPHALVLAGRAAGRRRAERHDVPQPRGGPLPAHQAGRAAEQPQAQEGVGPDRVASSGRSPSTPKALREIDGPRGRLRAAALGGLRPRHRDLRGRGRPDRDRRGHHLVELRGRRACASAWSCSAPSTRSP